LFPRNGRKPELIDAKSANAINGSAELLPVKVNVRGVFMTVLSAAQNRDSLINKGKPLIKYQK